MSLLRRLERVFFDRYGTVRFGWIIAAVPVVVITVTFALVYLIDRPICMTKGRELRTPARWGVIQGCRLQLDDGRFVDAGQWRTVAR